MAKSEAPQAIFSVWAEESATRESYTIKDGSKLLKRRVIAFKGKCVLVAQRNEYWGGKKSNSYQSPVLENPTWGHILAAATESIRVTRDFNHIFLEGYNVLPSITVDGTEVVVLELEFGS